MKRPIPSKEEYDAAFEREAAVSYPDLDRFEDAMGFAIDQKKLLSAAYRLQCPIKKNPPNWQHGRVLYSLLRRYIARYDCIYAKVVDIGTAKGFSALCMYWALIDGDCLGKLTSIDVIDPDAATRRNSVAEVDGPKTLRELLEPWPESENIQFVQSTGIEWLTGFSERIHFAFVDGKHEYETVSREIKLLAKRQHRGDIAVFDDLQIPGVHQAVAAFMKQNYETTILWVGPDRQYAIATRL